MSLKKEKHYIKFQEKLINVGKLREYNPEIDSNEELEKDQILVINSLYAKKAIIFIDSENYFPIYQMIYDEEGLYEKYSFSNLKSTVILKMKNFLKITKTMIFNK